MNEPVPPSDTLEDRIRAHLDRRAESVDPRPHFERLRGAIQQATPLARIAPPSPTRFRRMGRAACALLGAAVLLAGFFGWMLQSGQASAETLLRDSQAVHHLPVARCYLVEVRREAGWMNEGVPEMPPVRVTRLWTRGDHFWIEASDARRKFAWGRDELGVWIALGSRRGVRIDPDEVPPWLALGCDVNSMQLDTLLSEVLRHFDLRRAEPEGDSFPATYVVRGTPRPGRWPSALRHVFLEVDAETKVLRRAVLSRVLRGQPLATTTYTLVDSGPQPDANFRLEGHLRKPYQIFTRENEPALRLDILSRIYGPLAKQWFAVPPEKK